MKSRAQSRPDLSASEVSAETLGDVLDFMRLLWAVDHGLQTRSKRMKGELGVTGPQRFALRIIGRKPGISAGALASALHLDPSTVTGVLQRLETRGAIKRIADPRDGRRAVLTLTARGRVLDGVKTRTVESAVRRALESMSARHVADSRAVLSALVRELDTPE